MGFLDTTYTVLFEARFDDYLILSISSATVYASVISTQLVLNKDCREPKFISTNKGNYSRNELSSIIDQTNMWCDSLNFPRPIWKP